MRLRSLVDVGLTSCLKGICQNNLIKTVRKAFTDIECRFPDEIPPSTVAELRDHGLYISLADEEIYERVSQTVGSGNRSKSLFENTQNSLMGRFTAPRPEIVYRRHDDLIARESALEQEIQVLISTIALLQGDQRRLGRPKYLWLAVGTLAYFAVAGAVVPLGFLAFNPTDNGIVARVLVFSLFASGLVAVFVYIIIAIHDLQGR